MSTLTKILEAELDQTPDQDREVEGWLEEPANNESVVGVLDKELRKHFLLCVKYAGREWESNRMDRVSKSMWEDFWNTVSDSFQLLWEKSDGFLRIASGYRIVWKDSEEDFVRQIFGVTQEAITGNVPPKMNKKLH